MNMIIHNVSFSLLKEYYCKLTCSNNKVKEKDNCYDYDYKLNTIIKQRRLNLCFDHSQIKAN